MKISYRQVSTEQQALLGHCCSKPGKREEGKSRNGGNGALRSDWNILEVKPAGFPDGGGVTELCLLEGKWN